MTLLMILGWIACGIVAYICVKISEYLLRINGKLDNYKGEGSTWTYGNLLFFGIGCLALGPWALFMSFALTMVFLACHCVDYSRKRKKMGKKSWFDKKSPF